MNIGKSIRKIRIEKSLSQGELAKRCELSQNSLSQIELGIKQPSSKNLKKICEILEIPETILYFYSLEEYDVPERKRETYKTLFPVFQSIIEKLVAD